MKQNRRTVTPVVKEVPIPSTKPLTEGLDLLFEAMQLIECQADALLGAAVNCENLKHHPYLNIAISQKVQEAYENIYSFQKQLRGGVL